MIITLWSLDRSQLYRFLSAYHHRLSITAKECGWIDGWIDGGSQLECYGTHLLSQRDATADIIE